MSTSDLLAMTSALRSDALVLLEGASHQSGRGSSAVVDGLQHVTNELGSIERMLLAS